MPSSTAMSPESNSPRHTLYMLGAFDRFNFGDLLFPLLLSQQWQHLPLSIHAVALRHSDYGAHGALPTRALREVCRQPLPASSTVLVVGGEVLAARWYLMLRYLLVPGLGLPARILERTIPAPWLDQLSRRLMGVSAALPFVPAPHDFLTPVHTAFNAVGGSTLERLDVTCRPLLRQRLAQARHVSVRDQRTQTLLAELAPELAVSVVPDCGILAATHYPADALAERPVALRLRQQAPNGYLCIQAARYLLSGHAVLHLAEQLTAIRQRLGLQVVLLPLGRAAEHEDQVALAQLHQHVPWTLLIEDSHIQDLLSVIAGAEAFAGTSLHGNIVAMAYGVPHLGLTQRVPKLQAYLETWAAPGFEHCIDYPQLATATEQVLAGGRSAVAAAGQAQVQQVQQHLAHLAQHLLSP